MWLFGSSNRNKNDDGNDSGKMWSRKHGKKDDGVSSSPTLILLRQAKERTKRLQSGMHFGGSNASSVGNAFRSNPIVSAPTTPKLPKRQSVGVLHHQQQQFIQNSPRNSTSVHGPSGNPARVGSGMSRLVSDMIAAFQNIDSIKECLSLYFGGLERDDLTAARNAVSQELSRRANVNNMFWSQLSSVLLYLLSAEKQFMSLEFLNNDGKKQSMVELFQMATAGVAHLVDAQILACREKGGVRPRVASQDTRGKRGESMNAHGKRSGSTKPRFSVATDGSDADMFNSAFASVRQETVEAERARNKGLLGKHGKESGSPSVFPQYYSWTFGEFDEDSEGQDEDFGVFNSIPILNPVERELVNSEPMKAALEEYATVLSKIVQLLKLRLWTVEAYSKLVSSSPEDTLDSIKIPERIQFGFEELAGSSGYAMLQKIVDHALAEFGTITMLAYARYNISSFHLQGSMLTLQKSQGKIDALELILRETQGHANCFIPGGHSSGTTTASQGQQQKMEAPKEVPTRVGPFRMTLGAPKSESILQRTPSTHVATERAVKTGEISHRFLSLLFARRVFNALTAKATLFFYPVLGQRFERIIPQDEATRRKKRLVTMIRQFLNKRSSKVKAKVKRVKSPHGSAHSQLTSTPSSVSSASFPSGVNHSPSQHAVSGGGSAAPLATSSTGSSASSMTGGVSGSAGATSGNAAGNSSTLPATTTAAPNRIEVEPDIDSLNIENQPDVAVLLILDALQCQESGPPNQSSALRTPANHNDPRFTHTGGNLRAPPGQQVWQQPQQQQPVAVQGQTQAQAQQAQDIPMQSILPTDSPNGYICPSLVRLVQQDKVLKLRFQSTKQLRSSLGLANAGSDGYLQHLKHASEFSRLSSSSTSASEQENDMFRELQGVASWPVICKFPWDFNETLHMPNLVSLILDGIFDCVSAPLFHAEKVATYVIYKIDPTVHLAIVFSKHAAPSTSEKKDIVAFCNAVKQEITPK